jgi:phage gp29-like protein
MNFKRLFRKRNEPAREAAPQLTLWDRRAASSAAPPTGGIPYSTYDRMERDSMVQTALTVKKLGVLAVPFRIEPSGDAARDRFVDEAFMRMEGSPASILQAAMDAFAKGWSVQEMVYIPEGDRIWLQAVRPKDPALFGLEMDAFGKIEALRLEVPGETPRSLPVGKFVLYRHRGSYGRPKGRSDLDAAHPHWEAKGTIAANWRIYLAKYAIPTMLARCGPSVTNEERGEIIRSLARLESTTSVACNSDVEVQSLGAGRDASNAFMDAIDFHNREIARSILGQTLTTDEGRRVGSLAMGKVHLQVLNLQLAAIRNELADTVMTEQVIRPLVEMNFGPGPIPRFAFEAVPLEAFSSGVL